MSDVLERGEKIARELGLVITTRVNHYLSPLEHYYVVDDIHKLLGEATPMLYYENKQSSSAEVKPVIATSDLGHTNIGLYTHHAILIGLAPIRKDSAESLLKELIDETRLWGRSPDKFEEIVTRAKALLNKK